MTEKQRRFVEAYAKDPNATAAAKAAGYSHKTAYSAGQRLLRNVEIQEHLKSLLELEYENGIASIENVRRFWTRIMNDNNQKTTDRLKASELLGKSSGMFLADVAVATGKEVSSDVIIYLPQLDTLDDEEVRAEQL